MERISVPFSYAYLSTNWSLHHRVSGLMRLELDALVLEFRQKSTSYSSATAQETVTPLQTLRIPLQEIESISLGWRVPWGSKLVLTVHTLAAIEGLPNFDGARAVLRVPWGDHHRARVLANACSLQLVDRRLRELGEGDLV